MMFFSSTSAITHFPLQLSIFVCFVILKRYSFFFCPVPPFIHFSQTELLTISTSLFVCFYLSAFSPLLCHCLHASFFSIISCWTGAQHFPSLPKLSCCFTTASMILSLSLSHRFSFPPSPFQQFSQTVFNYLLSQLPQFNFSHSLLPLYPLHTSHHDVATHQPGLCWTFFSSYSFFTDITLTLTNM